MELTVRDLRAALAEINDQDTMIYVYDLIGDLRPVEIVVEKIDSESDLVVIIPSG